MKNFQLIVWIIVLSVVSFFSITNAQNQTLPQEAIVSYLSYILVNTDNSIDVTETITYNTGPQEHHGIYRDIHSYSSQDKKMSIDRVGVVDENGNPYQFQLSNSGDIVKIKIGDPNITFSGQKIYILRYHATNAVGQLKNIDEIYWNVTGNGWGMPIYNVQASVVLPSGASLAQSSCYFGPKGSTKQCQPAYSENGAYTFNSQSALNPYDGLTIAAGFPKGIVNPYSSIDSVSNFFNIYWRWIVAAIFPIITLILSLLNWYKNGRDAKGTDVIVPQYDIPENLTPMEVGGIVNEKVNEAGISAEIIYLATKGYLRIRQLDERFIGLIKSTDYEITKLKDFPDLPNDFDRKILLGLFTSEQATVVKLSDLKYVFYNDAALSVTSVLDSLLNKGYYKNLGRMKTGSGRISLLIFMSIWAPGFLGTIIGLVLFRGNPFPFIVGIFLSIVVYGMVSHFNPAKTEKGVATKEYILGLKNYLQIAEKDRLQFHNAPDKRPEVFEKLLPYAMILGVANIWAKEFEGIYTMPPSWYSGPSNAAFSAIAFSHSINNFSSFATNSLSSSPNRGGSGGSGGGGSSGGGGGGGGGGSW